MTIKTIKQLYTICMRLPNTSRSLSLVNAYTDQALMNLDYETMKYSEIETAFVLIREMVDKYRKILGR